MTKNLISKIISNHYFIPWCIFIFFTTIYFSSTVGIMNSVDAPQYALTKSIVDDHQFNIDKYSQYINPDFAYYNGHYYSLRSPTESLLAIPFYLFAKLVTPISSAPYLGNHLGINSESNMEAMTVLYNSSFGALSIVVLYLISLSLTKSKLASIVNAIAFGLGTLIWKYSGSFQRHSVIVFFLILGFLFMLHYLKKKKNIYLFLTGLSLGFCISLDNVFIFVLPFIFIPSLFINFSKNLHFNIKHIIFLFLVFSFAVFLPNLINTIYLQLIFGKVLANPAQYSQTQWFYKNLNYVFTTPLFPSLFINLFSNGPIPYNAISSLVWSNPELIKIQSANYALIYTYKGVFTISPYLFFSLIGFLYLFKKNFIYALEVILTALAILIIYSKFMGFYSPNSYDIRYFTPVAILLSLPFSLTLINIKKIKNKFLKSTIFLILSISIVFSIINGYISNISNYAPHITGEHRFLTSMLQPTNSVSALINNISLIMYNGFPNIYNINILIFTYFPALLLCHLVFIKLKKYLLKKSAFKEGKRRTSSKSI